MAKAIRIHRTGGPEVLVYEDVDVPAPGPGEALVRHTAIGLNFIDVYHRTGLYKLPALPAVLGLEAAGVVEAIGPGVTEVAVGDRVGYASAPIGAYCTQRLMPADRLIRLPAHISDQQAAASLLQGMTARFLLRQTYPVKPGDTILVHAAAGGVGLLLCSWAKHLGARVIGTVGSDAKADLARTHGCDHPIVYTRESFPERVREITGGSLAAVVYDSVGRATFHQSLDCLRPMGMMVSFGQSSGAIEPFDISILAAKGSLFLTRPSLFAYTARQEDLMANAAELFDAIGTGAVPVTIGATYPLAEAAEAHRALESRSTSGSTVFNP